jgi:hypothetical protein
MSLIFRVLLGYLLACLAAGLSTVLFAWTPSDLANMQGDLANDKLALAIPVATQVALFAAPFALLAIGFGESKRWRDWAYYAAAGMAIAMIGYIAQYQSEAPSQAWSVTGSNYPLIAFLTSGFVGGLVYWLFSGRMAALNARMPAAPGARTGTPVANNSTAKTGPGGRPTSPQRH